MSDPSSPAFALRQTQSAGLGLFATRSLAAGTAVLADTPLFTLPSAQKGVDGLYDAVRKLDEAQRRVYLGLANVKGKGKEGEVKESEEQEVSPVVGVFKTNVLPAGPDESGIFPLASRLNHSCLPSCEASFSTSTRTLHLHAVRPLAEDDELSISYLGPERILRPAAERQAWLLSSFGFLCECSACTGDFAQQDALRSVVREAKAALDEAFTTSPGEGFRAALALLLASGAAGLAVEHAFALAALAQLLLLWGAGGSALCERAVRCVTREMRTVRGEGDDWARWARWEGRTAEHPRNGACGAFDFGPLERVDGLGQALGDVVELDAGSH